MEIISNPGSPLELSDLATNRSSSGLIPEISTGLSLTGASDSLDIDYSTNSNRKESVHCRLPLLQLPVEDGANNDSRYVLSLADEFPGVHKALRETAQLLLAGDEAKKVPTCSPNNLNAPPLLLNLPKNDNNQKTYVPTMLQLENPEPRPQGPPPPLIAFLHPHAAEEPMIKLPEIPVRQFVPQLIDPNQIRGSEVAPPPLLEVNDPLSRMRKEGFELLRLPVKDERAELRLITPLSLDKDDAVTFRTLSTINDNRSRVRRRRRSYKKRESSPTLPSPPPHHSPPHTLCSSQASLSLSPSSHQSLSHAHSSSLTPPILESKVKANHLKDAATQSTPLPNETPSPPPSSHLSLKTPSPLPQPSPISQAPISKPLPTSQPPSSHSSPVTHAVAVQVDQTEFKSAEVQVGVPWQQCSTEIQTEFDLEKTLTTSDNVPQYLTVTDIDDDDSSSSNEDINSKGSGIALVEGSEEIQSEGSETLLAHKEESIMTSSDEARNVTEVLPTKTRPLDTQWTCNKGMGSNEVLARFEHLKDQLSAIEITANGIKDDFTNSRMILHTIDRISVTNPLTKDPHPHLSDRYTPLHRPHPLSQEGSGDRTVTSSVVLSDRPVHVARNSSGNAHMKETHLKSGKINGYEDNKKSSSIAKRKELKVWMKKKRKERMSEYRREREELIAKEREPYTQRKNKMENSGPSLIEDPNTMKERRRLQGLSDHTHRVQEAHQLMNDLLVSSEHGRHSSFGDSSKFLNSLAQSLQISRTPPRPKRTTSFASLQEKRRKEADREHGSKRRLSSIEGLNKTEQLKMAEILASVQIETESVGSVDTAESSIDWSQVDELLTDDEDQC